jgi:hypothetical protein
MYRTSKNLQLIPLVRFFVKKFASSRGLVMFTKPKSFKYYLHLKNSQQVLKISILQNYVQTKQMFKKEFRISDD